MLMVWVGAGPGWEQKRCISIDLGSAQVRDVQALVGEFQMCLVAMAWSKCKVIPGGSPALPPEVVEIMSPTKASRRLGRASRQLWYFVRNTMQDNWVVKCLFVINWMYQKHPRSTLQHVMLNAAAMYRPVQCPAVNTQYYIIIIIIIVVFSIATTHV